MHSIFPLLKMPFGDLRKIHLEQTKKGLDLKRFLKHEGIFI
jgi:hypothetical protein